MISLNVLKFSNNENWVYSGTHVPPAQALSENGNNSKRIESKSLTSFIVILPIQVCLNEKLNISTCKTVLVMLLTY